MVGVNGAGKSTLARVLAGVEPFQAGERDMGVNTVIGYFAQHQAEELNPANEVLAEVEEVCENNPDANPRAALGALLFSGNDAFKKLNFSGGEKNRRSGQLLMKPCNFLIMDEPTNHLDIRSKEVLQEALNLFEGTALIVSHDRSFLDGVVNKVLEISTRKAMMLTCNVTEYGTPGSGRILRSDSFSVRISGQETRQLEVTQNQSEQVKVLVDFFLHGFPKFGYQCGHQKEGRCGSPPMLK